MQFQATCSKWNKKLILTLTANDVNQARNTLHSQWYSIIEIHENLELPVTGGNFFYFDAKVSGILQSWKIQSTDIFKSYKKLTEDLKYEIIYIYTNEWMPEEAKKLITAKVKDWYRLYRESLGDDMDLEDERKLRTEDQKEMEEISWEVLREIEKYWEVIDSSIQKIHHLFLKYHKIILPEQKIKLENLENTLTQTKWIKNIWKIRITIENWLRIIWETELSLLKIGMTEDKEDFLKETNALLKQVGSKEKIESKEDKESSLEYKFNNLFTKTNTEEIEKKEKKDVNSFMYFKNKRELDIYKKKLNSTEIEILKSIFSFQFSQLKKLFLKRKLISQNIEIIFNHINNRNISYTKMIHGIEYYIRNFFIGIELIWNIIFYSIFLYTITYILLHTLDILLIFTSYMNGKSILFITLLTILALFLSYIRNIKSTLVFVPIFMFLVYFLSINF